MIVIVPPERYDDWLQAGAGESGEFLKAWPADMLAASSQQAKANFKLRQSPLKRLEFL
jgi:hypothetical protein